MTRHRFANGKAVPSRTLAAPTGSLQAPPKLDTQAVGCGRGSVRLFLGSGTSYDKAQTRTADEQAEDKAGEGQAALGRFLEGAGASVGPNQLSGGNSLSGNSLTPKTSAWRQCSQTALHPSPSRGRLHSNANLCF